MGDQTHAHYDMATTSTAVTTTVPSPLTEEVDAPAPVAVITLRRRDPRKRVVWTDDTVDNEHLNKKKSKCCCIYTKPRAFDESSSESDSDEGEHCFGHVERRARRQHDQHCALHGAAHADKPATVTVEESLKPEPAPAPPDKPMPST